MCCSSKPLHWCTEQFPDTFNLSPSWRRPQCYSRANNQQQQQQQQLTDGRLLVGKPHSGNNHRLLNFPTEALDETELRAEQVNKPKQTDQRNDQNMHKNNPTITTNTEQPSVLKSPHMMSSASPTSLATVIHICHSFAAF